MTAPSSDRDARALAVWRLALWLALLTGLLEFSVVSNYPLHRMSVHFVWMAPLADVVVFGLAAGALYAAGVWWKRAVAPENAAMVFAALATGTLALMAPGRLHVLAILILAAGVGSQARRLVRAKPAAVAAVVRRTFWWVPAAVIVLSAVMMAEPALRERRALAAVGEPAGDPPNILLLILDTVRAKSMGLYGYERPTTPAIDAWAGQGVVFDRAVATAPWTLTSHVGIFTGRYPHETSANWERAMDGAHPTIAEVLSRHGYETAGFSGNLLYVNEAFGLARGFAHWEDYPVSVGQVVLSSAIARAVLGSRRLQRAFGWREVLNRRTPEQLTSALLDWESSRRAERPFFAFVNLFNAHEPLLPPATLRARFGPDRSPDAPWEYVASLAQGSRSERDRKWEMPPAEVEAERAAYDGAIAWIDEALGRLFEEMRRRGLDRNTVVILASDHGEQFGEHGLFGHLNSLYMPLLHVPLAIVAPGDAPSGLRVGEFVTLADLPATLAAFAGVADHPFPGRSLARYWEDTTASPAVRPDLPVFSEVTPGLIRQRSYPIARGFGVSLVEDGRHLIRYGRPDREPLVQLFDVTTDLEETEDLAAREPERTEAMAAVVDSVRGR